MLKLQTAEENNDDPQGNAITALLSMMKDHHQWLYRDLQIIIDTC